MIRFHKTTQMSQMSLSMTLINIGAVVLAYIIGSIPTGFLIARLCGISDIRNHGSGTIGATNVARVLGKKYFILIFAIDVCKAFGWLLFLYAMQLDHAIILIAAGALVLGNIYSLFLSFTGGKGIATSVGVLLALQPMIVVLVLMPFLAVLALGQTVGFASVVGLLGLPVTALLVADMHTAVLALFISALSLYAHQEHVKRMLSLFFS